MNAAPSALPLCALVPLALVALACGTSSSGTAPGSRSSVDSGVASTGVDAAPTVTGADAAAAAGDGAPADAPSPDVSNLPHVTIWLAGDSLVENYSAGNAQGDNGADREGWGQEIAQFFNNRVSIQNQAIGGRSVADFIYNVVKDDAGVYQCIDDAGDPLYALDGQGNRTDPSQWGRIKGNIAAGDFLLIEFGTNDETHTCPRYVTTADFETDLGIMADTVRAKGATPIFVTPPAERQFNADGTIDNILSDYVAAMEDEGTRASVQVADLNAASIAYYETVGDAYLAASIFDGGTTHYVKAGAIKMASLIATELQKGGGALAQYVLPP
jgi:lysophospholipase L1-like esterase